MPGTGRAKRGPPRCRSTHFKDRDGKELSNSRPAATSACSATCRRPMRSPWWATHVPSGRRPEVTRGALPINPSARPDGPRNPSIETRTCQRSPGAGSVSCRSCSRLDRRVPQTVRTGRARRAAARPQAVGRVTCCPQGASVCGVAGAFTCLLAVAVVVTTLVAVPGMAVHALVEVGRVL